MADAPPLVPLETEPIATVEAAVATARRVVEPETWFPPDATPPDHWHRRVLPRLIWYRGHGAWPRYRLTSSVLRQQRGTYDETSMFAHFRARAQEKRPSDDGTLAWLCLMQHYGLPTRLLDWTESILVALYFAAYGDPDEDGAVYAILANRLDELGKIADDPLGSSGILAPDRLQVVLRAEMARERTLLGVLESPALTVWDRSVDPENVELNPRARALRAARHAAYRGAAPPADGPLHERFLRALAYPCALHPVRTNPRMIAQSSVFTIDGGKRIPAVERTGSVGAGLPEPVGLEELDARIRREHGLALVRAWRVPASAKATLVRELANLGIHGGALFPEIESQSRYVREQWFVED